MTTARLKIMGVTQDVTDCDCCGRTGLKRTVILGIMDRDGNVMDVVHYGTSCASRRFLNLTGTQIERKAEEAQRAAERAEQERIHDVNAEECDTIWVIERIGNNGGSITRLCLARGTCSRITPWAREKFPHCEIHVRVAR